MIQITSSVPEERSPSASRSVKAAVPEEADSGLSGTVSTTPMTSAIRLLHLPVDAIQTNPRQPRQVFDEDALDELTASIGEVGLLQPVVVREVRDDVHAPVDTESRTWQLVAGERRLRSVRALGWDTVPALVRETPDDVLLRDALVENLQRTQLNPLEEAAAYAQLLEDFGCTQDELARRVGRSRPHLTNTLRLLRLPAAVQRRVASGVLSQGHARALLSLPDAQAMERLATRIVAEGLSVRSVEEIVAVGDPVTGPEPAPRRRTPRTPSAELSETARSLSDRFDTRVSVSMGRVKGKVVIEFAGRDDLERILGLLGDGSTT